ncbi:MAG: D-Ala-D-Ala carboxypeptidase family metallohydrolase [Desulfobacterales bacterium]|nr:D-Ala-D-Ala carboxypeptidase family metallohydrolase [Desulfobacterales bacterium]
MDTNDMQLSEHFSLNEMTRSDTAARKGINNIPPANMMVKLRDLCVQVLEPVRLHFGVPIRPSSGYRSPELNLAVGGAKTSQHPKGEAVDFEVSGVSNYDLACWIQHELVYDQLILECYTPGVPDSGWVHVSYRAGRNRKQAMTYVDGQYVPGLRR